MDTDILLESGTNELEILCVTLGRERFGINVAKVIQIIQPPEITEIPLLPNSIKGIFTFREEPVPLIDLPNFLKIPHKEMKEGERPKVVVTEFNALWLGFLVDGVDRIYRKSWDDLSPPPPTIAHHGAYLTMIAKHDDSFIQMLDLEKVLVELAPELGLTDHVSFTQSGKGQGTVIVVDDSNIIRDNVVQLLKTGGYDVVDFGNGQDAWDYLCKAKEGQATMPLVMVSDIEMPIMDGTRLLRLVREDPVLKDFPVILYSSLITDELRRKVDKLRPDGHITKPQIQHLVGLIEGILEKRGITARS